jgi:RecA-family ATPase
MVKAVAIVTGRDLLGCKPIRRLKVWYWNLEDSMEEIERRFHAIFLHYGIKREEIEGQLFVNSGRDTPFSGLVRPVGGTAEGLLIWLRS